MIAFLLFWNLTVGGLLVRQARKDHASTTFVAQIVMPPTVFIVAIVWLLRTSRRPLTNGPTSSDWQSALRDHRGI